MKKAFMFMLAIMLVVTLSVSESSASSDRSMKNENEEVKQIEKIVSVQKFDRPHEPASEHPIIIGELVDNGYFDKETGKVDKEKLKQALLDFIQKNPDYDHLDVESVVEKVVSPDSITPNTVTVIDFGFRRGSPYITSSTGYVTYSTTWLLENNYRSAVAVTVGNTRSQTTTRQLGFTGSNLIKNFMSFSGTYTESQTVTVSIGTTVPAWTVWAYRPYIKWAEEQWKGTYYTTFMDLNTGMIWDGEEEVTGTNRKLNQKANEYWSRVNTSKDPNATTPSPPTGPPL